MTLKHGKYVYVQLDKNKYVKMRYLKSYEKAEKANDVNAYIILGKIVTKVSRKAKILKREDLPVEVRDKLPK
ncbi:hypothetical protein EWF20_08560 [Sulfolobus sp. S-194]|uniref:DUF5622 domain-containing protein n=1 Tax=Sulfolobus sp. S-194 TaxID=2512240 RepID=UPI0014370362|nr:DUF5622 domain-containing protein [Sulfolobus sp. S-194]QIW24189.1 hypothetical protein EWF20_08560 [Sulfolobus sp. S-194]